MEGIPVVLLGAKKTHSYNTLLYCMRPMGFFIAEQHPKRVCLSKAITNYFLSGRLNSSASSLMNILIRWLFQEVQRGASIISRRHGEGGGKIRHAGR